MVLRTILLAVILCRCVSFGQVYLNSEQISEEHQSDTTSYRVLKIEIAGNYKTKEYIIRRELHFDVDDIVQIKEFLLAQKRILNLFLFNRVIFDLVEEENETILLITLAERWYIFPVPIFYINDRNWHKISYGGKLLYYNFLGRDMLLNFTAAFGYNPEFKLAYRDPWFGDDLKLFTNIFVYSSKVESKSEGFRDIEDERIGLDWLIGKRFGYFSYFSLQAGYLELREPEITLSDNGIDKLPSIAFGFLYDNRDLKEYPHNGYHVRIWGTKTKYHSPINFSRYGIDFRKYFPISTYTTLACRVATDLSKGKIPHYERVFLGYSERVRGIFYRKYEGENLIVGGTEFRFPIKKIKYVDLAEMAPPGFEDYYRNLKFGISAGIFYDFAAIWYQNETLAKKHYKYGFGAGIHFHLPYIELFRFEVGFDKNFNHQFIGEVSIAY